MEPAEAALRVLEEEAVALHWTVIQDLALRRGYLDPFTQSDLRRRLLAGLGAAVADGRAVTVSKGVFAASGGDTSPEGDVAQRR